MNRHVRNACFTVLVACGSQAAAAPITSFGEDRGVFNQDGTPTGVSYTNSLAAQADFLLNLVGVGTESFEGSADGATAPLALSFPGAGTATLQGGGAVDNDLGTGQNAITGSKWWRTGLGNSFSIDFDSPVAAFGFFGIDVGDVGAQLTLTLINGSSVSIDIPHTVEPAPPNAPSGQNGSVIYFGVIDTSNPWTRVEFRNLGGGSADDFGFDDMTIGSVEQVIPVSEPASLALVSVALAGLALSCRRRN